MVPSHGIVDLLWFLDLLLSRAEAARSDFLLAGPISHWLRVSSNAMPEPYFILVASQRGSEPLAEALSIGAELLEWEDEWRRGVASGLVARLRLRGYDVALLGDPVLRLPGEGLRSYKASELARAASHVILGRRVVRLVPLGFEADLGEALGEPPWSRVNRPGGQAKR